MKMKQTRLVTEDVARLAAFYEAVTGAGRRVSAPAYVELGHPCEGLAIVGVGVQCIWGRRRGAGHEPHSDTRLRGPERRWGV